MNEGNGYTEYEDIETTPKNRAMGEIHKLIDAGFSTESLRAFIDNTESMVAQDEGDQDLKTELLILAEEAINAEDPDELKNVLAELRNASKEHLESSQSKR